MSKSVRRQTIFVLVFLLVVLVFVTTFRLAIVRGDSMETTYHDGQVLLVRRRNRFSGPLHRGDVVVLRKDRDVIIKRVSRLPGDELTDKNALNMTFNNNLSDYYEQPFADPAHPDAATRLIVPAGYIVVLGDNRRISEDSRFFGPIPLRDVLGVVIAAPSAPPGDTP